MSGSSIVYGFLKFLYDGVLLGVIGHLLFSAPIWYMSRKRSLRLNILAWLPLGNLWFLGSLCDQYWALISGKNRKRRWWLAAMGAVTTGLLALNSFTVWPESVAAFWATILDIQAPVLAGMILVSLYRVYFSCAPDSAAVFFVLSIVMPIAIPIFLMIDMEKELGMPPRRETFRENLREQTQQLQWPQRERRF